MKNIIVGFFTILVVGLMAWTASQGGAYHGGAHNKVIADFGDNMANADTVALEEKSKFAIREGGRTVGAGVVTKIIK